jgi:hypothetical protein
MVGLDRLIGVPQQSEAASSAVDDIYTDLEAAHPETITEQNLAFGRLRDSLVRDGCSEAHIRNRVIVKLGQVIARVDRRSVTHASRAVAPDASPVEVASFRWLLDSYEACTSYGTCSTEQRLRIFPHYPLLLNLVGERYASCHMYENAVRMVNLALDCMLLMCPLNILFTEQDSSLITSQWRKLQSLVGKCGSLTKQGAVKWCESKSAAIFSRFAVDHHEMAAELFSQMKDDVAAMHEPRLEKHGNVLLIYLAFFVLLFLALRCYITSGCAASTPQIVQVDSDSFVTNPPSFKYIAVYPRCASQCANSTVCTCPSEHLTCSTEDPLFDTICTCSTNLDCDACTLCGKIRSILRNYAVLLFFGTTLLDMALLIVGLFTVAYPSPTLDGDPKVDAKFYAQRANDVKDVAVLIAHYGATGPIEATLKAALEIFPPDRIYLCHNAPSDAPMDPGGTPGDSLNTVRSVSNWYREQTNITDAPDINYTWTAAGNKTLALFQTARHVCTQKYVIIMDNDCELPKDLLIPTHWFDEYNKVIAFTIRAQNTRRADSSTNFLTTFQDMEYKKAGLNKLLQAMMGSALFAHGAIAMWSRETLVRVLQKHNTMFHGEDLQMGLILHKSNYGEAIRCVGNVSVPTRTPAHFICFPWDTPKAKGSKRPFWYRLLLAPYKCNAWGCGHEEKSLFVQRVRSWEAAAHRMIFDMASVLFLCWKRSTLGLKPFLVYELYCVLQDWIRFPLGLFLIINGSDEQRSQFFLILFLLLVGLTLLFLLMELWTFRKRSDLQSGLLFAILYPYYNAALLVVRFVGLIYNMLVYLPLQRNSAKIKNRPRLPPVYEGRFISLEEGVEPPKPDGVRDMSNVGNAEASTVLRGCMRVPGGWQALQWNPSLGSWDFVKEVFDADPLNLPRRPTTAGRKTVDLDVFHFGFLAFLLFCAVSLGLFVQSPDAALSSSSSWTVLGALFLIYFGTLELARFLWNG